MRRPDTADAPDTARVLAPPPVIFLGALGVGVALGAWRPLRVFHGNVVARMLAGGLILGGLLLSGAVVHHFGRAETPVTPWRAARRLVVSGPYRLSRNPDYVGQALVVAGLGLLLGNGWVLLAMAPALLLVRYGVIAREERYLERKFGEDYRHYRERVRRWL
jgi:protein-S-isoprenylcysteine O-methyltransferase Ste14